jgi:ubiquinone/menaquinone biosynthesis C-methylase UbiE/ketosteroid isomerase-like protein
MRANVDLVRSIYAAWERGDFSSAEWADSELDYIHADGPSPGHWTGLTGMAEAMRDWLSAWEAWRTVAEEYRELDDERVLVLQHWGGRGKTSGLEVRQTRAKGAALFHVRDGQVTKLVVYWDRKRALADLGLAMPKQGAAPEPDPAYVMGRSEHETMGLEQRARFFHRPTRLLFEDAGITTGMKVLDIGSGAGDVSFLAAELVGERGQVVGVDMNPAVVDTANRRAQAAAMTHVSFKAGDIREIELGDEFDAVVGRLVLMYSADPAATLRAAAKSLRSGGVAAVYEMSFDTEVMSYPHSHLHQFLGYCVGETFRRGGVEISMGQKIHQFFLDAGFEAPRMQTDALVGGGADFLERFVSSFGANMLRSMLPSILEHGVASEEEIAIDAFDERYLEEVLGQGSVVQWFPFVAAWAPRSVA